MFGGSNPYSKFSQGGTKKDHIKINDDTDKLRWYLNKIGGRYTTRRGYRFWGLVHNEILSGSSLSY